MVKSYLKTTNNQNQTSIGKRVSIWKKYLNEIKSHKYFGKGLGSVSYLQKKIISLNPHNYYIFILTEGGIVGLILLLNIFINMFNKYINDKNRVLKLFFLYFIYLLYLLTTIYLYIIQLLSLVFLALLYTLIILVR